jgi:transcriptional regulator with XRE-family HTH domain
MLVSELLSRLREHLKDRIRRGEFTERSLSRRVKLSQAHVHNVLKGARAMSPQTADRFLNELGISISDLIVCESAPPRKSPGSAGPEGLAYRPPFIASR